MNKNLDKVLKDRGTMYGDYSKMAECICEMQRLVAQYQPKNESGRLHMTDAQHHSLDMIMTKIGRIITGNPNHSDNWLDIEGYARLARENIEREKPPLPMSNYPEHVAP